VPSVNEIKQIYQALGNYFQLAFGAGEGLTFEFDIGVFCKSFNQKIKKTLNALKFLEHDGYLALSENIYLPSRVLFIIDNEEVYRFQIEHATYDTFIKTILRSYGGIFEQFVKINEAELATRLGMSYIEVSDSLKRLHEMGVLNYLPQTDKPQLQFLRPRTDPDHLDIDGKFIEVRKKIQEDQIKAVIDYASETVCRSIQLLSYFNEINASKCGVCDFCIEEKKQDKLALLTENIDFEIITILQSGPASATELQQGVKTGNDHDKLIRLQDLLDAGKIRMDGGYYHLS
ncbi:MAG: RecQ family ATP-dependent DNA helicase, partial [Sphingobacteriales bacterium]